MDSSFLDGLETALQQSPDNLALRFTLINAYFDHYDSDRAVELLLEADAESFDLKQQLSAARIFIAADMPTAALNVLRNDDANVNLMRARTHFALEQIAEAKNAYEQAITANPALEDLSFAKLLNSPGIVSPNDNTVKLRVISNDDTDTTEITRVVQPQEEKVTFSDVGGLEQVKKQIRKKIIVTGNVKLTH